MEGKNTRSELLGLLNQALARELQVSIQYMLQKAMGTCEGETVSGKTREAKRIKFVASRTPAGCPSRASSESRSQR